MQEEIRSEMQDISLDVSVSSVDDSLYLPTPEKMVRENVNQHFAVVPYKICFMELLLCEVVWDQIFIVGSSFSAPGNTDSH